MKEIPDHDRPRERLVKHGPESLSTAELIAILLGSGTKQTPILQLSQEIVSKFGTLSRLSEATIEEFCEIRGVGPAKAIQLRAALALGVRVGNKALAPKYKIESPGDAYLLLKEELSGEKRELFVAILQDTRGCVINHQIISIGTLSNSLVHPREVFYPAIRHKAASVVLAHNHPSGDPSPSKEDLEVTKRLLEVGKVMGIPVNDHLIIAEQGYTSLRQSTTLWI